MRRSISFIALAFIVATTVLADRRNTSRSRLSTAQPVAEEAQTPVYEFIIPDSAEIVLSGYDKPLRSTRETEFITNNTPHHITRIVLTTVYFDINGRMLHTMARNIDVDLPAGDTRKIDFTSWDRQKSFYYHRSTPPRTSAIPYSIKQSVDTAFYISQP